MGIGIVTGQPFSSREVIGMERNGQVGMVTLAHQVTLSRREWSGGGHAHPPALAMTRIFFLQRTETSERMW